LPLGVPEHRTEWFVLLKMQDLRLGILFYGYMAVDSPNPWILGNASIKIPTLTQSGTVFRLKGKGMKSVSGYGVGDEYVTVTIKVPKSVSKKEREMIEELARLERE